MRLFFVLLVVSTLFSFSAPAAVAMTHPFKGFRGYYKVIEIECVRDGYRTSGCDLQTVSVRPQLDNKTVELRESGLDRGEVFYPRKGNYSDQTGYSEISKISGDGKTMATWDYERHFSDGTVTEDVRVFSRQDESAYYHIAKTKTRPDGSLVTFKQTYLLQFIHTY